MCRCNYPSGCCVIFSNLAAAWPKEVKSEKHLLSSSLEAAQGCSVGMPIKQSQTPPPALPKASIHISYRLCRQAVSYLSCHSLIFASVKEKCAWKMWSKVSLIMRCSQLSQKIYLCFLSFIVHLHLLMKTLIRASNKCNIELLKSVKVVSRPTVSKVMFQ